MRTRRLLSQRMAQSTKYLLLFFAAMVACPVFVLFHEASHYAVSTAFGRGPRLHYRSLTETKNGGRWKARILVSAAGPACDAIIGGTGVLTLYLLRRRRGTHSATWMDWCATIIALPALRWLRGFGGTPANPQPHDEAVVSHLLGLPQWLLPYALTVLCIVPLVMMVRLHPPRERLWPLFS